MSLNPPSIPVHLRPSRFPRFLFGATYYPEHWPLEQRLADPANMAAAGTNVVRLAEFAWDFMEPRLDQFDFSLFDETIDRCGAVDIDTILCTPTAAPPRWLTAAHPEWLRVDANGRAMTHGSRQHCCTTNPGFREASRRITRAMADHFAVSPRVIGWQIDNEFNCHFDECHCDACLAGFRDWLRERYTDIATLNEAWGTAFWAQTYDDFDQIEFARLDRPTHPNPSQHLDLLRFYSDAVIEFQREQVAILRAAQPNWWITHNGLFDHIDYNKFATDLDFLSVDLYPGFSEQPAGFVWSATTAERTRAASGTFIVPEQQAGAGGQRPYLLPTTAPGQMRLWTYQSIAHGAAGILHFRWRTCPFGAEMYWNGILDHDDVPRRRYHEFAQEGAELARIGPKILGTTAHVRAAVLLEVEQDEAYVTMSNGLPRPKDQRDLVYGEMLHRHLAAGFVASTDSFDGLDLIVLSNFVLMDEDLAARLRAFVDRGGLLVATARTATRDRRNQVIRTTPPGLLADVFGVTVEEFGKLDTPLLHLQTASATIPLAGGYEIVAPTTAEPLATWTPTTDRSPHAAPGTLAGTINRHGTGAALYLGTWFSKDNVTELFDLILAHSKILPLARAFPNIEITRRVANDRTLTFVLNHEPTPSTITGLPTGTDLLAETECLGTILLPAYGAAIIESEAIL